MLHTRQRRGRAASGRGAERFVNELGGRIRRAGAAGPLTLRADSGFWSAKVLAACRRHGIRFSVTARLTGPQATLWPDWRHPAFVTDRQGSAVDLDVDHRRHAVCKLAIRDLNDGAGLRHCPSGRFRANAAWLVIAALPHNLLRWVATIGLGSTDLLVAKTLRRRLLHLPGRLTRSARQRLLHLPTDWPWATQFLRALTRLRAVLLRA